MTYNEFVGMPADLLQQIWHKVDDVQLKWTVCLNTVPELGERVQTSVRNNTEASIIRYSQAKGELDALFARYDKAVQDIRDFLYENLSPDEADVLDWRYCGDKSNQQIAELKNLSYSGASSKIYRADRKAMEIYDMLQKRKKNEDLST